MGDCSILKPDAMGTRIEGFRVVRADPCRDPIFARHQGGRVISNRARFRGSSKNGVAKGIACINGVPTASAMSKATSAGRPFGCPANEQSSRRVISGCRPTRLSLIFRKPRIGGSSPTRIHSVRGLCRDCEDRHQRTQPPRRRTRLGRSAAERIGGTGSAPPSYCG